MIATELTHRLGIQHPVLLGGMGTGNGPDLVGAVSSAGGLGILGCVRRSPDDIRRLAAEIRQRTDRPFGLNLLLFQADREQVDAVLGERPAVLSTAWPDPGRDLRELFARAHDAGCTVLHMVSRVDEAVAAAEAGARPGVAQGAGGGGPARPRGPLLVLPPGRPAPGPGPGGGARGR